MSKQELTRLRSYFEDELDALLISLETPIEMIKPMLYSLKSGGKRLRPLLLLSILEAESNKLLKKGIMSAIALEFIHTYSLIHDDLPSMDNDDLRRGQPTSHVKFDEATAILAGDALLTDAFGLIAEDKQLKNRQKVKLISELSTAAGSYGMVSGQLNDIHAEDREIDLKALEKIHYQKTGKLFIFAASAAGIIGNFESDEQKLLHEFAEHFGVAYQIHNDLLDVQDTVEISGKSHSSDQFNKKSTYPSLLGLNKAQEALLDEVEQARTVVKKLVKSKGINFEFLNLFIDVVDVEDKVD